MEQQRYRTGTHGTLIFNKFAYHYVINIHKQQRFPWLDSTINQLPQSDYDSNSKKLQLLYVQQGKVLPVSRFRRCSLFQTFLRQKRKLLKMAPTVVNFCRQRSSSRHVDRRLQSVEHSKQLKSTCSTIIHATWQLFFGISSNVAILFGFDAVRLEEGRPGWQRWQLQWLAPLAGVVC